jgi:hypothetical protein
MRRPASFGVARFSLRGPTTCCFPLSVLDATGFLWLANKHPANSAGALVVTNPSDRLVWAPSFRECLPTMRDYRWDPVRFQPNSQHSGSSIA